MPSLQALAAARQLNMAGVSDEHIANVLDHHFASPLHDAARLDWLTEKHLSLWAVTGDGPRPNDDGARKLWQVEQVGIEKMRGDPREAIDAARSR